MVDATKSAEKITVYCMSRDLCSQFVLKRITKVNKDTKDAFVKECPKLVECIKGEHSFACYFKTRFPPVVTEFIPQLSV